MQPEVLPVTAGWVITSLMYSGHPVRSIFRGNNLKTQTKDAIGMEEVELCSAVVKNYRNQTIFVVSQLII